MADLLTQDPEEPTTASPVEPGGAPAPQAPPIPSLVPRAATAFKRASDKAQSLYGQPPPLASPSEHLPEEQDEPNIEDMTYQAVRNIKVGDVVDFLAGPELALLGVKRDAEGDFGWSVENIKKQLSDAPVLDNVLAGFNLVTMGLLPLGRAVQLSTKFGKLAYLMGKGAEVTSEISKFRKMGMIAEGVEDAEVTPKMLGELQRIENHTMWYHDKTAQALNWQQSILQGTPGRLGDEVVQPLSKSDQALMWFHKNFGNAYIQKIMEDYPAAAEGAPSSVARNLQRLQNDEQFRWFLNNIPEDTEATNHGVLFRKFMETPDELPIEKVPEAARPYFTMLRDRVRANQSRFVNDGFMDEATAQKFPNYWAIIRNSEIKPERLPNGEVNLLGGDTSTMLFPDSEGNVTAVTTPRLTSRRLLERTMTPEKAVESAEKGTIVTDFRTHLMKGVFESELLHDNYALMRDAMTDGRAGSVAFERFEKNKDYLKDLTDWVNPNVAMPQYAQDILRRMVGKANPDMLGPNGELPILAKQIFNQFMDPDTGSFAQTRAITDLLNTMTTAHKSLVTALNPRTHVKNILGQLMFSMQGGFNPFSREMMNAHTKLADALDKIIEIRRASKELALNPDDIFDPATEMGRRLTASLPSFSLGGQEFKIADLFQDPTFLNLIEKSSFESAEGFTALRRIADQGRGASALFAKGTLGIYDAPGVNKLTRRLSKWYLLEDIVPKAAAYTKLLSEGYSSKAAGLLVARRFPMYNTVGPVINNARKFWFPWASFPTEALRITKNNLMDHPIRMMPWLRAPQIMQSMLYAMGGSGNPSEVEAEKQMLPMYGQTPTTVVGSSGAQAMAGNLLSGATIGTMAGGLLGKSGAAAYAGGALGAAVGAWTAKTFDDGGDQVRGAVLDMLPHASFMLRSNAREMRSEGGALPFRDFQSLQQQVPAQPVALVMPLLWAMTGKDQWGNDLTGVDTGDRIGKAFAGMASMFTPPLVARYLFRMQEPVLPLSAAVGKAVGHPTQGLPGDITNVSRVPIDLGLLPDPKSHMMQVPMFSFFSNNFGAWPSYTATPSQLLYNMGVVQRHLSESRGALYRRLGSQATVNPDMMGDTLKDIYLTYLAEFPGDIQKANGAFRKSVASQLHNLRKLPGAKNLSEKDLKKAVDFSSQINGPMRDEMLRTVHNMLASGQVPDFRLPGL